MKNKNKFIHGNNINEDNDLDSIFDTTKVKVTLGYTQDELDSLSLDELKNIALDLNLRPVDNKRVLLNMLKKSMK